MVERRIIEIGRKIRKLRQELNLSLRDLAKHSGISASSIHKIESNAMVPSIAVLIRIAQALRKNVSYLIGEEGGEHSVVHVRPKDREVMVVEDSRLVVENIASSISEGQLEVTLLHVRRGGRSGKIPLRHAGEEIKFCLKGKMEYTVERQKFILQPGDCLHFNSGLPHSWRNVGKGSAEILSVCTPPPFRSLMARNRAA